MHKLDWDDLRYVLGVAEQGSIGAAAQSLAVNRTTVLRRIKRFEGKLGCQLFELRNHGYALTPEAERLLSAARDVERTLVDLERQIAGREIRLEGEIRVTTTDALLMSTVAPFLATFSEKHPDIVVEVDVANHRLNLSRRDADVAIRPIGGPPKDLVGRRLTDTRFCLYGNARYLAERDGMALEKHRWLGIEEPLHETPAGEWLQRNVPTDRICLRAGSFVALRQLAEAGMGIALLPVRLGDQSSRLVRHGAPLPGLRSQVWVLTHADLAQAARIRAFVDHIAEAFAEAE